MNRVTAWVSSSEPADIPRYVHEQGSVLVLPTGGSGGIHNSETVRLAG